VVFFSVMWNKLPGYVLPALPAAAALAGIALDEIEDARVWLAGCALLLVVFLVAAQVLPAALLSGLSHAPRPVFRPVWLAPIAVAGLAWWLDTRGKRLAAAMAVAAGVALCVAGVKATVAPELDRSVSARGLWRQIGDRAAGVCLEPGLQRDWVYGLNYYGSRALPECDDEPAALRVQPAPGDRAVLGTVDPR
jgi:hypothetical protein